MKNHNREHTRLWPRLVAALSLVVSLCLMSSMSARAGHPASIPAATDSILQATLSLPDTAAQDKLGQSVAISGNTAIVGSLNHRPTGSPAPGTAAIFQRTGLGW